MSDTTDRDDRDERVRRLLAEARHDAALPTDVAARLDRVLEQLAEGDTRGFRTLDELAARRRRRARGMLVAAAAVAVVGIGLGQVVPGAFEGAASDIPAGAAESADGETFVAGDRLEGAASGRAADDAAPSDDADAPKALEGAAGSLFDGVDPELAGEAGGQSRSADSPDLSASSMATARGRALVVAAGRPVELRPERFVRDALRARTRLDAGRRGRASDRAFDCDLAGWGPGTGLAVRYGGRPHVLVFREPAGETQVVDLLQCGTGEILRSTTLPAD
ncbi:hypothetical protein [Nocardioides sp. SYSU DS0663]|uniref:hypothetical protein n=1 Tax=Nocardioides sp. SYSU DS0663 TaxID=3416445 RepID=UPI003F4C9BC6